jgi:hypothetical protein
MLHHIPPDHYLEQPLRIFLINGIPPILFPHT